MSKKLGFLSMQFEKEEKRDFRPGFFGKLNNLSNPILLDKQYGAKLGFTPWDYTSLNPRVQFVERNEVLKADVLISVRTPSEEESLQMRSGATILSMLHYETHERRNNLLHDMGIQMYSMDAVVDDFGLRMIQDFPGTVHNAMLDGYRVFQKHNSKDQIRVLVIGSGELGKLVSDHAIHLFAEEVIVSTVGRKVTGNKALINQLLSETDILVDATKRRATGNHIIHNNQLEHLHRNAVIIDISADDYDTGVDPIQVKAIEGIPTGNLDQTFFDITDPAYDIIPPSVSTEIRRYVVSCYSWPGVHPINCLKRYETQLEPFIRILATGGPIDPDNTYHRALEHSSYQFFLAHAGK